MSGQVESKAVLKCATNPSLNLPFSGVFSSAWLCSGFAVPLLGSSDASLLSIPSSSSLHTSLNISFGMYLKMYEKNLGNFQNTITFVMTSWFNQDHSRTVTHSSKLTTLGKDTHATKQLHKTKLIIKWQKILQGTFAFKYCLYGLTNSSCTNLKYSLSIISSNSFLPLADMMSALIS